MDERNVGDLGEDTLVQWCSQVGIIATKSYRDRKGWDFVLELPTSSTVGKIDNLYFDKTPTAIKCWIQVKATDKHPGSWPVKLDNWERLVKDPLPAFFLIMKFHGQPDCQQAYLVHVDKSHIERVQRELRRISIDKDIEKHKAQFRFSYNEANALPSLDGNGLRQAIQHHVGNDLSNYCKEKIEAVNSVGYENGGWHLSFSASIPEGVGSPQEYFVDFALGLVPHLDIVRHEIHDARFGMTAAEPTEVIELAGRLEITDRKSVGTSLVRFSTHNQNKELLVRMETHVPSGLAPVLGAGFLKIRLAVPFVDLIIWHDQPTRSRLSFHIPDIDVEYDLHDLYTAANLVRFLHKASAQNEKVHFQIFLNEGYLGRGDVSPNMDLGDDVLKLLDVISFAWTVTRYHSIDDQVSVKPIELFRQYERLVLMALAFGSTPTHLKLGFWSDPSILTDKRPVIVPNVVSVLLGPYRIITVLTIAGNPVPIGNTSDTGIQLKIETQDVRLEKTFVRFRSSEDQPSLENIIGDLEDKYSETHQIVVIQ